MALDAKIAEITCFSVISGRFWTALDSEVVPRGGIE